MELPKLAIASDHAGVALKAEVVKEYAGRGAAVSDFGPWTDASVDYPDYAVLVAEAVSCGQADFGILICGTGIGMAIAANKLPSVRAANLTTPEFARLARQHNDANIACLSARFIDTATNLAIIEAFLATGALPDRHAERVGKVNALDQLYRSS